MAIDKKNQKICRIPSERDAAFSKSIPAAGSLYFRQAGNTLIVGDANTPGGIEFVSREWVLQQIMKANQQAKLEQEMIGSNTSTTILPFYTRHATTNNPMDCVVSSSTTISWSKAE